MKNKVLLVILALFTLLAVLLVALVSDSGKSKSANLRISCGNMEKTFRVELAENMFSRSGGLSNRENICKDDVCGMLFVFEKSGNHGIWMKDMNFPLDVVFIDENGTIIEFASMEPCEKARECPTYVPKSPSKYVLEMQKGFVEECNIDIGEKIFIEKK